MIKFHVVPKKNPQDKSVKWYAQAATPADVSLDMVARRIEKQSTVSSSDIKAVLDALQDIIIDELQRGNSVKLGDLGSFRITLRSEGTELAEDFTAAKIKGVHVVFNPSTAMDDALERDKIAFEQSGSGE